MTVTRAFPAGVVSAALAAEACCDPSDFLREGVHLLEAPSRPAPNSLRRRFPQPENNLTILSMGAGAVVAATPAWMPWVRDLFRDTGASDAFNPRLLFKLAAQVSRDSCVLHGPIQYFVTSSQDVRLRDAPAGYTVAVGGVELLRPLHHGDWPNAISPRAEAQGRGVAVAAVASQRGRVVGVAAATEDSDALWQIGVDVHLDHRRRGLGTALTSRVAQEVLGQGRVPYYGAAADNSASRRTAESAGFYPCWTAAFTTESR